MPEIKQTERAAKVLKLTMDCCKEYRHEFVMPEHLLLVLTDDFNFERVFGNYSEIQVLGQRLEEKLDEVEQQFRELLNAYKAKRAEVAKQIASGLDVFFWKNGYYLNVCIGGGQIWTIVQPHLRIVIQFVISKYQLFTI